MKRLLPILVLTMAAMAATAAQPAPKPLRDQVGRLIALLRDSHASGYPEATLFQSLALGHDRTVAAAVFTIEGFGGGNNHTQFFALFEQEPGADDGPGHFSLIDVIPVGGKGWRAIHGLDIAVSREEKTGRVQLSFPALEVAPGDAANFPSRKTIIRLVLDGRLSEAAAR